MGIQVEEFYGYMERGSGWGCWVEADNAVIEVRKTNTFGEQKIKVRALPSLEGAFTLDAYAVTDFQHEVPQNIQKEVQDILHDPDTYRVVWQYGILQRRKTIYDGCRCERNMQNSKSCMKSMAVWLDKHGLIHMAESKQCGKIASSKGVLRHSLLQWKE